MQIHHFRIADFYIRLIFQEGQRNSMRLLPSFKPFVIDESDVKSDEEPLFQMTIDDTLQPYPRDKRERIRDFDTGNGNTIVDQLDDGGYQYIIKNINGADCCMLQSNKSFNDCHVALNGNYNMRCFGLNNALMLVFAFAASYHNALLIHASLVRHKGFGYPFIAKSGTGKSTQVSSWLKYIPDCDLMNDDNPIVRYFEDENKAYIYGCPWSGKTPCYRNVKAPLGAITRIDRAPANSIERMAPIEAFASFLPACSTMRWDSIIYNNLCDTITRIVETTPIYTLHCLPDRDAAELCNKTISR